MNRLEIDRGAARASAAPTPADDDRVCVIIVTYNSMDALPGLLDSVSSGMQGVSRYEVIVADNASTDRSAEFAATHPVGPRVLHMGRNAGYAAAINAAASLVDPDTHLLILNPDIRLFEGCVAPLVKRARMSGTGIAVPCNLRDDGSIDPTIRRQPSLVTVWSEALLGGNLAARFGLGEVVAAGYEEDRDIAWATGSALLIAPRARRVAGAWDESFFLYSEEVDYQQRVRDAGLGIAYVASSRVTHVGGPYRRSRRLYALLTSNRIRYFNRRHGVLSALLFRLGIAVGEAVRAPAHPVHRAALACALLPLKPALSFRGEG